ncbi:MAG: hypothetical protein AAB859_00035 [Patescibacteria group bacterium]
MLSKKDKRAFFRTLSAISANLSAGWFGVVFIASSTVSIASIRDVLALIYNLFFGILFLFISYKFEKIIL